MFILNMHHRYYNDYGYNQIIKLIIKSDYSRLYAFEPNHSNVQQTLGLLIYKRYDKDQINI